MLKNHLKIALRNLRRQAGYSLINIAGLAVGMACCLLIGMYVADERSYDRFFEHADRIVRVVEDQQRDAARRTVATTYGPLAPALQADVAAVEEAVRFFPYSVLVTQTPAEKYQEDGFAFVDSTFLEVFDFKLLRGNRSSLLDQPFSVVLTASTAQKYFGTADPMGQVLQVWDDEARFDFTVTGVLEDVPGNTHFTFDMLGSMGSVRVMYHWALDPNNWEHPPMYTYALLADHVEPGDVASLLPALALKHMGEDRVRTRSLHLERLTDIQLHSAREANLKPSGHIAYVYLFMLIGGFILLIACINFINLTTAQAARRVREVGIRKALGAQRNELVGQFLSETVLMTLAALVLALVLTQVMLPVFNEVSGKTLPLNLFEQRFLPLFSLVLVVLIGLLAGGYPAFYLARFQPAQVLKGNLISTGTSGAAFLRKGLVVFQFVVAIVLMIGTVVAQQQLNYLRNERLGFEKENMVLVQLRDVNNQIDHTSLKAAFKQIPGVQSVTASSGMPGLNGGIYDFVIRPEDALADSLEILTLTVDHNYVRTYGLEVVAGRDFSEAYATDAGEAFLINEAAAELLGWAEPVGKRLTLQLWYNQEINKTGTVVGVVRDFQYQSLHQAVAPLLIHMFPDTYYYDYVSVRLNTANLAGVLSAMEQAWAAFNPARPLEIAFLDEQFDALYRMEERIGQLFGAFTLLSLFIACLGLFGLSSYTATQRTKEIGIRKVLGATVAEITGLLSKDFLKLVSVAFIIAAPIAYVSMAWWLGGFAYRIGLGLGLFFIVGLSSLTIAFLTVSYQSIKAALANPVDSLRYE